MRGVNDMTVEVHCDTTELDSALAKMDLLIKKATTLEQMGMPQSIGLAAAGALIVAEGSKMKVSRRQLFLFWKRS